MMLWAAAADVELTPLGAPPVKGEVTQWTSEKIVVKTAAGEQSYETPRIHSLKFGGGSAAKPPAADVTIQLLDGSELRAASYQAKSGKASGKLANGGDYEFRTRAIRAVRFKPAVADLREAWQQHLEAKATGDVIVIRKTPKGSDKVTLDRQSGIVHEVTADTIQFELDGDRIPVKRERIEGVVYFQASERDLPDPVCRIEDRGGSVWNAKSIRWEAGALQLESVAGATVSLAADQLVRADFSVGNTIFLSDVDPEAEESIPFIESRLPTLAQFRQLRRDTTPSGGKLSTNGETFDKGLLACSRTSVTYRVPRNFRRLETRVGILDGEGREQADLRFSIKGDGKVLYDGTLTGQSAPVDVALDLTGVRQVTLFVDFGANGQAGDWLVLGNARMTK